MLFNRHSGPPCPKCGGVVGPHSDFCLDCGYDTAGLTANFWISIVGICLLFLFLLAA